MPNPPRGRGRIVGTVMCGAASLHLAPVGCLEVFGPSSLLAEVHDRSQERAALHSPWQLTQVRALIHVHLGVEHIIVLLLLRRVVDKAVLAASVGAHGRIPLVAGITASL